MHEYEILPGLPPIGPLPSWFPAESVRTGREGFVVRFTTSSGRQWTGNFATGLGGVSDVLPHPDGTRLIVLAEGDAYVVDVEEESAVAAGVISDAWAIPGSADLLCSFQGLALYRLGPQGVVWHTRRLSWDGFRNIRLGADRAWGQAWSPLEDGRLHAFSVDLATGRSKGGAPSAPNPEWEQLAVTDGPSRRITPDRGWPPDN